CDAIFMRRGAVRRMGDSFIGTLLFSLKADLAGPYILSVYIENSQHFHGSGVAKPS
ncbi:hypothetical protein HKBW3S43_01952, partial [Candidatus Hakubella thermalkaliphila]